MIPKPLLHAAAATTLCLAGTAQAHFQLLYVDDTALPRAHPLELAAVFTHPFSGGPTMAMGTPRVFTHIDPHGKRTDLLKDLRPVQWQSRDNQANAYRLSLPREAVRTLGDHTFLLEPEPYLEAEEGLYIQQFTKLVINVGGVPGNWSEPQGVPVEIQPLGKPYANWTGSVFRARVLADGKPVPFAKIEVEYLNNDLDLQRNAFGATAHVRAPQASFNVQSMYADDLGIVTLGLPRAGWWGIAALDIGTTKTYNGKTLSQDAVLWVQATDMQ
ncbi:DUF4198 domain-containing protein [Pseudomonas oryzihabitans]|uniref:DUF4198 domain-containing protein n=1 Tax=Pseudomonas oryzihabitans TaxID=47885 RepID=UPI002556C910|nr:DUF4198 domain-containing protein [Pseudomonas oryzihabitans]MDK8264731.1 DUF4198 domain-containing protein [Pseudomonas oryzihabitans]